MQKINRLFAQLPESGRSGLRHIELLMLRPSMDLGRLANEYEADLPKAFRFFTRGLGTRETRSNDMLSLVMFQSDYVKRLIELGEADATARMAEIARPCDDVDRSSRPGDDNRLMKSMQTIRRVRIVWNSARNQAADHGRRFRFVYEIFGLSGSRPSR